MSPDIIHDIFEGVIHVVPLMILKDLIIKKPLLRIQQLNGRIESFCYGPMETFNKLSLIKETGFSDMNDIKPSGKFLMIMM